MGWSKAQSRRKIYPVPATHALSADSPTGPLHHYFLKPLLEIIATEQHEWLPREATEAANKLGGGFDLLDTWADRLAEEHLYGLALDSLQTVIEGLPGGSSGRTDLTRGERIELRNQWRSFLARHGAEIRAGKKFKLGDPALTPALFGHARTWQLPNGKFWPVTWSEMDGQPQNKFDRQWSGSASGAADCSIASGGSAA